MFLLRSTHWEETGLQLMKIVICLWFCFQIIYISSLFCRGTDLTFVLDHNTATIERFVFLYKWGSEENCNILCKCCLIWAVTIAELLKTIFFSMRNHLLVWYGVITYLTNRLYPVYSHWCALYLCLQCE